MSDKRTAEEGRFAGLALAEEELVARVAWCYYHDGLTQNDIGERLGLPRLKISRLLEKGRQSGVIRVQINSRYEGCLALETELQQRSAQAGSRVAGAEYPAHECPAGHWRSAIADGRAGARPAAGGGIW